ncbi:MAG: hypothetical protein NTY24_10360 [Mycobacterium sp.]|nr:hypothetical protein [Mycobacterium sp.]
MPAAATASASPAFGPNGAPAVCAHTHSAAAAPLTTIPAASSKTGGRVQARIAQISWNTAMVAKNNPDGIQSRQCAGVAAKWITAAPREAIAAARAAIVASLPIAARELMGSDGAEWR